MRFIRQNRARVGGALLILAIGATLLTAGLLTRAEDDPFLNAAIEDAPFNSLSYGVQASLWWNEGIANVHLDWIRTMAFSHVKQIFAWENIEPGEDLWMFHMSDRIVADVERRGLKLVVRLSDSPDWARRNTPGDKDVDFIDAPPDNLADWAEYCQTVASRYRGRIAAYQIWNEPNLAREWGNRSPNAADYVDLLRACSAAIRDADPDAIIISAGLAPTGNMDDRAHRDDIYLNALYQAGFQEFIDVVGMHAPGFSAPELSPDVAESQGIGRWFTFRRVEDLRKIMIANGDAARQAALLEVGWTTDPIHEAYSWFAVDEETQARNLVAAYAYAVENWRPWVGLMTTIYIADPQWTSENEEYWWSITAPEGYTRQAFTDLANMAKYCGERVIPQRAPDSPEALGLVPVRPCS